MVPKTNMQIVQAARASAILYNVLTNLEHKDPWLVPANICPIVPITFLKAGVPFHLIDISDVTWNIDQEQAEHFVRTRKVGGLLYAHTYGDPTTPNDFFSTIKNIASELIVIDDRCLCVPDLAPGVQHSDIQLYSTGYAKIAELNFGGYAFLGDHIKYRPLHLDFNPRHHEVIENSYKDAIRRQVKFVYQDNDWLENEMDMPVWSDYQHKIRTALASALEHREQLNHVYSQMLPEEIQFPDYYQSWRFNIRLKKKDEVLAAIFAAGLFASSHYASLAGIMDDGHAPRADRLANEVINLFNDHHFTVQQAEQACAVILENISCPL